MCVANVSVVWCYIFVCVEIVLAKCVCVDLVGRLCNARVCVGNVMGANCGYDVYIGVCNV